MSLSAERSPLLVQQAQTFQSDQNYAVLVGVKNYPTWGGLRSLQYTDKDVADVAAALQALKYHVLPSLIDSDALKGGIEERLTALGRSLSESDKKAATLVFFFSGHGWAVDGKNYLATFDARSKALADSGLSVDALQGMLTRTGIRRILLIIDACRDDPSTAKDVAATSMVEFREAEGVRILFATRVGDYSYESSSLRHSVFSYYLIDALSGKGRDPEGYMTSESVLKYVSDNVRRYARENSLVQAPFESGEHTYERFLIAPPCSACPAGPSPASTASLSPSTQSTSATVTTAKFPGDLAARKAQLDADGGYCGRLKTIAQWTANLWKGNAPAFTNLHPWKNSPALFELTPSVDAYYCKLSTNAPLYRCDVMVEGGTRMPESVVKSRAIELKATLTECFGRGDDGATLLSKAFPNVRDSRDIPYSWALLGTWKTTSSGQTVSIKLSVTPPVGTDDSVYGSWGWLDFQLN
jgi:hypothetical protein